MMNSLDKRVCCAMLLWSAAMLCASSVPAQTLPAANPNPNPVAAASAPARTGELKIGFVNTDKLRRESAPAQRAFKKLEREFATRQAEVEKLAKRLRDTSAAYEKEQLAMSEADRRNKERELEVLRRDVQRAQRELREDENLRLNEELAALQDRAQKAIQKIAEAERFDLILQEAVYVHPRIDITDRVLKALAE